MKQSFAVVNLGPASTPGSSLRPQEREMPQIPTQEVKTNFLCLYSRYFITAPKLYLHTP